MADDELSHQVSQLSTRLIQAIDRQADLEDQVQILRKELDVARRRNLSFEDRVSSGELVSKATYLAQVKKATKASSDQVTAERESARLQAEIEELTSSLFNEANKMVADANRETSVWGRKNETLKQQLKERDIILESLQEQLAALKAVLQDVSEERDMLASGKPPGNSVLDSSANASSETFHDALTDHDEDSAPPELYSVSLNSSERPVIRHDLQSFYDFLLMVPAQTTQTQISSNTPFDTSIVSGRSSPAHDDVSGIPSPTANISTNNNTNNNNNASSGAISSIASRIHNFNSNNTGNSTSSNTNSSSSLSLKDFKFFKRSISEDIEPTLRLDSAPGLNWLSRRNILSSIFDGSIKVEPIAAVNEAYKLAYSREPYVVGSAPTQPNSSNPSYTALPTDENDTHGASSFTHSSQPSQGSIATQATSNSVQSFPTSSQTKYYASISTCVASTSTQGVYATLVGSAIPGSDSNSSSLASSAPPPVATLSPCSLCGEKRTSSLLYARLHNLRSDKEKDKDRERSSSVSAPNPSIALAARDYFSVGDKSNKREDDNVTAHLGHMTMFSALSTPNYLKEKVEKDREAKDNSSIKEGSEEGDSGQYAPLTPSISSSTNTSVTAVYTTTPSSTQTALASSMTNASSISSGYPLCYFCLHRVRTVCDYVSFIRAVRLGVWKTDDSRSRYKAWEECIRLKERMFWARLGSGFLEKQRTAVSSSHVSSNAGIYNASDSRSSLHTYGLANEDEPKGSAGQSLADPDKKKRLMYGALQKSTDALYGVSRKSSLSVEIKDFVPPEDMNGEDVEINGNSTYTQEDVEEEEEEETDDEVQVTEVAPASPNKSSIKSAPSSPVKGSVIPGSISPS